MAIPASGFSLVTVYDYFYPVLGTSGGTDGLQEIWDLCLLDQASATKALNSFANYDNPNATIGVSLVTDDVWDVELQWTITLTFATTPSSAGNDVDPIHIDETVDEAFASSEAAGEFTKVVTAGNTSVSWNDTYNKYSDGSYIVTDEIKVPLSYTGILLYDINATNFKASYTIPQVNLTPHTVYKLGTCASPSGAETLYSAQTGDLVVGDILYTDSAGSSLAGSGTRYYIDGSATNWTLTLSSGEITVKAPCGA
jgi:hypothetical protein